MKKTLLTTVMVAMALLSFFVKATKKKLISCSLSLAWKRKPWQRNLLNWKGRRKMPFGWHTMSMKQNGRRWEKNALAAEQIRRWLFLFGRRQHWIKSSKK